MKTVIKIIIGITLGTLCATGAGADPGPAMPPKHHLD